MIDNLITHKNYSSGKYDFSIIIPTWNNLDYLKLCIDSINKNSALNLQIIVFVNEGNDGTPEWLSEQSDIDYIQSEQNLGVCYGVNACRSLVKSDYILYLNDDMYALPGWDTKLKQEISQLDTKMFMLSSTLVEPFETGNNCVVVADYGDSLDTFQEVNILKGYTSLGRPDWSGSTWPPNVVHIDLWDLVGGLSTEFSPGMYSDPDFSVKLYNAGVRIFKGLGSSLVYHFGSKTTGRIKKNKGRDQFLKKWGFSAKSFTSEVLKIGNHYSGPLQNIELSKSSLINKLKTVQAVLK